MISDISSYECFDRDNFSSRVENQKPQILTRARTRMYAFVYVNLRVRVCVRKVH